MMRHATTSLLRRGNLSRRALPISAAPGYLHPTSHHGGVQRLLASSSKAPPITTKAVRDKGQEAIDKAERLHAELNEMIAAQKVRQLAELQQPFGSGFLKFLKGSKPEIFNIVFAFLCVLLAYQIHGMRAGIRKLLAAQEEKDAEIDRLRGILATFSEEENSGDSEVEANDDSFSMRLARKCADVVRDIFEESEQRAGYSWILGKKLASGDAIELEGLVDEMRPIILTEIQSVVGDAAFTPEELKERGFAALKVENESIQPSDLIGSGRSSGVGNLNAQMGDLMGILEEVHNQDLTDEQNTKSDEDGENAPTKVRRTRYAI